MAQENSEKLRDYKDVWVSTEIQDHERVLDGSLELLTKGRELVSKLGQNSRLFSIVFGLEVEQYLPIIEEYSPDVIIYSTSKDKTLKHYNGEIFPAMWEELIKNYKPSIILFPATEAGSDLAPRLAQRFSTGLTAHCSDLDIIESKEYKGKILLMKRPAFSGNLSASIICPKTRPQLATVQQGVFEKKKPEQKQTIEKIKIECTQKLENCKVVNIEDPTRWQRKAVPLEKARVVVSGGRGLRNKKNFQRLTELADLLEGEVGATRVSVFNGWCPEERMIGQTGKVVRPEVYLAFGISGQIQHTSSIMDAKRIISVNSDANAPINEISDYYITEDANIFIPKLIERLKKEKKVFKD
jgi:electron transfer flavoprotein alpha subunit